MTETFMTVPVERWVALLAQGWEPMLDHNQSWGPLKSHHGYWSAYIRRRDDG